MRRLSLGRTSDVGLEQARGRASELTSAARQGRDLLAEEDEAKDAEGQQITIEKLVGLYLRRRISGRLRTAKEIESRLRRTLDPVLKRSAADIRRRDLRELFEAAADAGHTREADQRRQAVGAMFRWAVSQDIVEADPTVGLKAYDPGTPRDRVLRVEEVEALWKWLNSEALPQATRDVLRLELLTGARCGELAGMQSEEFDRVRWTWTLPASRSKNGRPRVTPIVGAAREILAGCLEGLENGPLFTGENGSVLTSSLVGQHLRARWNRLPISKFRTHDLRRTTATMMAEMGIALDLVAAVIGHEAGARDTRTLVRHYVRSDLIERKAHALSLWDARLKAIVTGAEAAKVVQLRGAK
jgi:integrase